MCGFLIYTNNKKITSGYLVWQLINIYYMAKIEQQLKIKKSKTF